MKLIKLFCGSFASSNNFQNGFVLQTKEKGLSSAATLQDELTNCKVKEIFSLSVKEQNNNKVSLYKNNELAIQSTLGVGNHIYKSAAWSVQAKSSHCR